MKTIALTKGVSCVVDDEDYANVNQYKWYLQGRKGSAYAARRKKDSRVMVYMHREILKTPSNMQTHHINGNRLDNRRSNLIACTRSQNSLGASKKRRSSSNYRGVSWNKEKRKWESYVAFEKQKIKLGYFKSEKQAAIERDEALRKLAGTFPCEYNFNTSQNGL